MNPQQYWNDSIGNNWTIQTHAIIARKSYAKPKHAHHNPNQQWQMTTSDCRDLRDESVTDAHLLRLEMCQIESDSVWTMYSMKPGIAILWMLQQRGHTKNEIHQTLLTLKAEEHHHWRHLTRLFSRVFLSQLRDPPDPVRVYPPQPCPFTCGRNIIPVYSCQWIQN